MNNYFRENNIPLIGLGTWPMKHECIDVVHKAIDIGYRHIDTAQYYENEKFVGRGIQLSGVSRQDLFLVTKIRRESFEGNVIDSVRKSLDDLGTNYVDLLLLHDFFENVPLERMMKVLSECKELGFAKRIGVSNYTKDEMQQAARYIRVEIRQDKFFPFMSREDETPLIAFSPLKHVLQSPKLEQMARKYGKTPAQAALRWITQQGIAAIPKSSNNERLRANIDIFDFSLEAHDIGHKQ